MKKAVRVVSAALCSTITGASAGAPPLPTATSSPTARPPTLVAPRACDASNTLILSIEKPAPVVSIAPAPAAAKPLTSFSDAVKLGQARGACFLTIEAGPGRYDESIDVTFPHLKIKGRGTPNAILHGSITNTSGRHLEIETLVLDHANKVAVRQVGGKLVMTGVRVQDTEEVAGDATSGVGVWISGGAQAVLRLSVFERNPQAIRAEDASTKLWTVMANASSTSVNSTLRSRMIAAHGSGEYEVGAVLVQRSASAFFNGLTLQDSALAALQVKGSARARLDNVTIRKTTATGGADSVGGFGIMVRDGAAVEWSRTTVNDSALCGFSVQGSTLTTNGGAVVKAPVGACLQDPVRQTTRCLQRGGTEYREVTIPLQAPSYSLPELGPTGEPVCTFVPAEPLPSWL